MLIKSNIVKSFCVIFILLLPYFLRAQNAVEDIQKINTAYLTNSQFSMDMEVSTYNKPDSKKPDDVETGFARRKNELLHTKMGDVETIKSVNILLSIDHKSKIILISESLKQDNKLPGDMASSLQILLEYCEKVNYIDLTKKIGKYVLIFPSFTYEQFEFEFNKETYFLEKLLMIKNSKLINENTDKDAESQNAILIIEYKNINTRPEFSEMEFTTWKYIYKDGNEYKTTKEYQEYQIINQLPIK